MHRLCLVTAALIFVAQPASAQMLWDQATVSRWHRSLVEAYEIFKGKAFELKSSGRELTVAEMEQVRWYEERCDTLLEAADILKLIRDAQYRPNESDLALVKAAREIAEGVKTAPSFESPFGPDDGSDPMLQKIWEFRRRMDALTGGIEDTDARLARLEELLAQGTITRLEFLKERYRLLKKAEDWTEILDRLEKLRAQGQLSEYDYLRERYLLAPNEADWKLLLQQLAVLLHKGAISETEYVRQVEILNLSRPEGTQILEGSYVTQELKNRLERLTVKRAELVQSLSRIDQEIEGLRSMIERLQGAQPP